jgi:hypothetical protein
MAGQPNGGELPGMAQRRVAGKPYICTEWNEPAPNTHSSEAFLLAGAYAALQDWDGIFIFAYSHRTDDWDARRVPNFFDLDQNPTKLVTLPAAAAIFRRGDIAPARQVYNYPLTRAAAVDQTARGSTWWGMEAFGMPRMLPFESRVQFVSGGQPPATLPQIDPAIASDTHELTWDVPNSRVLVDSPRSKAYIGKVTGVPITLGDITIAPGRNMQDWTAITVTDMAPAASATRTYLVTATGYSQNTGMQWTSPEHNSVGTNWGTAPSLVEGIPAAITFSGAGKVEAWSLDSQGHRKAPAVMNNSVLQIGPGDQTLWYEVSVLRR